MSSTLHPASLVDPSEHSQAMSDLLELGIDQNLINYAVQCTTDAVDFAMSRCSTSGHSSSYFAKHAPFTEFVSTVLQRSEVKLPVLLVALVYIHRAERHLTISLEQWACERVFLGALIIAAKYLNDSTLKNMHWALCTGVFGKRDVGRIEREFLEVLDWDLHVSEDNILLHYDSIMALQLPPSPYCQRTFSTAKRQRSTGEDEASVWSDDSDDSSSSGSSSPCSPPSQMLSFQYHHNHPYAAGEPAQKRQKSDAQSSLPQRPARPRADTTIPIVLDILKSFPMPLSWGSSSCEASCKLPQPPCSVPSTQIWV